MSKWIQQQKCEKNNIAHNLNIIFNALSDFIFIWKNSMQHINYISKMKWKFVILEFKICNIEIVMSSLKNNFILWEIKFIKKNNFKVQILFFK